MSALTFKDIVLAWKNADAQKIGYTVDDYQEVEDGLIITRDSDDEFVIFFDYSLWKDNFDLAQCANNNIYFIETIGNQTRITSFALAEEFAHRVLSKRP